MSLLSKNSPSKTRARKAQARAGETQSPTLNPVVKKIQTVVKDIDVDQQQTMLDRYSYTPEPEPEPEPIQLNRSLEPTPVPELTPKLTPKQTQSFNLYDLSFLCEERIYNVLYIPMDTSIKKLRKITLENIKLRLEVFSEYTQEVSIGAFQDRLYFYRGEILIPEEFIPVTGFMREFLKVERVSVLYDTGEILSKETNYCSFWLKLVPGFFKPKNIPMDKLKIQDEDVCLDCNLSCIFRRRQQMTKLK